MGGHGSGGHNAKPTERKRTAGNPGKRPLPNTTVALRPANDLDLEAPAHFGPAARFVWERAWSAAITWLSPDSDMAIVTRCCELADLTDKARERYMVTTEPKDATAFRAAKFALLGVPLRTLDGSMFSGQYAYKHTVTVR